MHIFFKAFDEVNAKNQDVSISVLKILSDQKHNFKIYITSRPHYGGILKKICDVIEYGILPFQLQEQMKLFG